MDGERNFVKATVGTTYYVDSRLGCDDNDGVTEGTPWKTLARVNAQAYGPGDRILFRRDASYHGNLCIHAEGSSEAPTYVGAYGEGEKPRILAKTGFAVTLRAVYTTFEGFEITNPTGVVGIYAFSCKAGANCGLVINDCYIHDVNAKEERDFGYINSGGIILRADGEEPVWFEDAVVSNNIIRNTSRMGITLSNSWGWRYTGYAFIRNPYVDDEHGWYPNVNCQIVGNTMETIGGDAILVQCGKDIRIERNTVYRANASTKPYARLAMVAIWTICTVDTVMQYNEVGYTRRTVADGEAFDTDHSDVNCTIQYNYTHNNEGGFVLVCNGFPGTAKNPTIRYNLSVHDGAKNNVIQFIGTVPGTRIYNNTFYLSAGAQIAGVWDCVGRTHKPKSVRIFNNIFSAPDVRGSYNAGGKMGNSFAEAVEDCEFSHNLFHNVNQPVTEGGLVVKDNVEGDPAFERSEDFGSREAMIAAFTPKASISGAASVPDAGEDIVGAPVSSGHFGCVYTD